MRWLLAFIFMFMMHLSGVVEPVRADPPPVVGMFGSKGCDTRPKWGGGFFGGYHHLLVGYENYGSLWVSGVDIFAIKKLVFRDKSKGAGFRECRDNLAVRMTLAYSPVVVPSGNYSMSEDFINAYFTVLYRFGRGEVAASPMGWFPFAGGGAGVIFDSTSATSPASGELSGTAGMLSLNLAVGAYGPRVLGVMRVVPEVRIHALSLNKGFNVQTSAQLALVYWPDTRGQ
jgi:hypothetical protein